MARAGGCTPGSGPGGDVPLVTVETALENPHRLVKKTATYLRRATRDGETRGRPTDSALDIAVSEAAADRALRMMDALIKTLESRGHTVELREVKPPPPPTLSSYYGPPPTPGSHWHTYAVIDGSAVEFGMEEGHETIEVLPEPPTGVRASSSWALPRPVKERVPNGRLVLLVRNAAGLERHSCADTKRQILETRLGTFVLMLEAGAVAIKQAAAQAARRAEENRRWEESRRKEEERRQREEGLARDLEKRMDLWDSASRIREFAEALTALPPGDQPDVRERWLDWVRSYAARVERRVLREIPDPKHGADPYRHLR